MSNQNIETPWEFIYAVQRKFGQIGWDLAASAKACKAVDPFSYFDEAQDSLTQNWNACGAHERTWLNPPFRNMRPWLKKAAACRVSSGPLVIMQASVCTELFDAFVRPRAMVYELMPRVWPEVRDVILCDYREIPTLLPGGGRERRVWRWK